MNTVPSVSDARTILFIRSVVSLTAVLTGDKETAALLRVGKSGAVFQPPLRQGIDGQTSCRAS